METLAIHFIPDKGELFGWYQPLAVVVLIVLLVFWKKYRDKQT